MQYIKKSYWEMRESNNFETFSAYKNIWIDAGYGNGEVKGRKERKRE